MKIFKKATALALCACLSVSSCAFVMAEDTQQYGPEIYVNGQYIDFEGNAPVVKDGYVFAPYESVFGALGAQSSYSASNKTVTAVSGSKEVTFAVDSKEISVTENGALSKMDMAAPAYTEDNEVYVPVRYAAQALGARIGWDEKNNAVLISDTDLFISQHGQTFETADRVMAYMNEIAAKKQKVSGSIDFTGSVSDGDETISLSGNVSINGNMNINDADINCVVTLNEKELKAIIDKLTDGLESEDRAEVEKTAEALKSSTFNFILDGKNLVMYVNSSLFTTFMGLENNAWVKLDLNELMKYYGIDNMKELIKESQGASFSEQIAMCIDSIGLNDLYQSQIMFETYGSTMDMLSDSAFSKTDGGYVSTVTTDLGSGAYFSMSFKAATNALDEITGYGFSVIASENGKPLTTVEISSNGTDTAFNMDINIYDIFKFSADGTIKQEETAETVKTAPDSSNIIDLNEYFESMLVNYAVPSEAAADIYIETEQDETTDTAPEAEPQSEEPQEAPDEVPAAS
ncbi:stalk domain-containing protein [Lachnospiraceae bacterium NSJ-143]|nr:stalk domain-containing protein [Lachnospiraceae bacterium NSJ-143]